jgi:hypothetical protein
MLLYKKVLLMSFSTTLVVLHILVFMFFDARWEDERFATEWCQALQEFSVHLISSWIKFSFVMVVPKFLNCATFSNHMLPIFISWFCPAFWWRDSNICLVFSVFTSRPITIENNACKLFTIISENRGRIVIAPVSKQPVNKWLWHAQDTNLDLGM